LTFVVDAVGFLALLTTSSVKFPLSSSLPTEFLDGRRCSNCGFGSALCDDCRQVV
jgi:hypothetical protein